MHLRPAPDQPNLTSAVPTIPAGIADNGATGDNGTMSRTDRVVNAITQMILDGNLTAGDRLPVEADLAKTLEVSRGSLREGVRALAVLGIVESRQGDGTYVTSLGPEVLLGPMGLLVELQGAGQALAIHTVRRLLEGEAAALAARASRGTTAESVTAEGEQAYAVQARLALATGAAILADGGHDHEGFIDADISFHRAVANWSGNPVLSAMIEALAGRTARHRLQRGQQEPDADARSQGCHEGILRAIEDGDSDRARTLMSAHLLEVEDFLAATQAQ